MYKNIRQVYIYTNDNIYSSSSKIERYHYYFMTLQNIDLRSGELND